MPSVSVLRPLMFTACCASAAACIPQAPRFLLSVYLIFNSYERELEAFDPGVAHTFLTLLCWACSYLLGTPQAETAGHNLISLTRCRFQQFPGSDYQAYIHTSKYARWIHDKRRRESWPETITRYLLSPSSLVQ